MPPTTFGLEWAVGSCGLLEGMAAPRFGEGRSWKIQYTAAARAVKPAVIASAAKAVGQPCFCASQPIPKPESVAPKYPALSISPAAGDLPRLPPRSRANTPDRKE